MQIDDLLDVMEIEKLCFRDPWTYDAMLYEMNENKVANYTVGVEKCKEFGKTKTEKVVSYAGMWAILDEGHITNIAVHPDFRRTGYGKLMLFDLFEIGTTLGLNSYTLEVRTDNTAAIKMYEKFGFQIEGTRKEYYEYDKSDAFIMWKR